MRLRRTSLGAVLAAAHHEHALALRQATEKQARMYQEAEGEIGSWLQQLDDARAEVLRGAREEADQILRSASDEASARANAHIEAAMQEAQRIVAAARQETEREHQATIMQARSAAPPTPPAPIISGHNAHRDPYDALFPESDEHPPNGAAESAQMDDRPAPPPAATAIEQPARHRRRHRFGKSES